MNLIQAHTTAVKAGNEPEALRLQNRAGNEGRSDALFAMQNELGVRKHLARQLDCDLSTLENWSPKT